MNRAKGHGLWPWIVRFKRFLYILSDYLIFVKRKYNILRFRHCRVQVADRRVVRGGHGHGTAWKESEHGLLVETNSVTGVYRDG